MKKKYKLISLWSFLSILLTIFLVIFICSYILIKGSASISWDFVSGKPSGMPIGSEGGIFPAIIGSLYLLIISTATASILAVSCSVYQCFYCRSSKINAFITLIVECTAGIPSIVLGLFGYTFFVLNMGFGKSILSGGLTLGIMIFPFIEVRIFKALMEVPKSMINSSYALGVSKAYTIFKIALPYCKSDIIPAISLAGGFSMGAAAPVMFTSAVLNSPVPKSIMAPSMNLPYHLYILINEGISISNAYGTAFILIAVLLIINFAANLYALGRRKQRHE